MVRDDRQAISDDYDDVEQNDSTSMTDDEREKMQQSMTEQDDTDFDDSV